MNGANRHSSRKVGRRRNSSAAVVRPPADRLADVIELPKATHRFELTLRKPWLGWFPKPTVVIDGLAQPTQWGTRNWKVAGDVEVTVFLYNRLWKFGEASFTVREGSAEPLVYTAPWLPFLPGRVRTA